VVKVKILALIIVLVLVIAGGFLVLDNTGYIDTGKKVTLKLDNSRTQGTATFLVTYTLSDYHIDGNIRTLTRTLPYNAPDGGAVSVIVLPSDTIAIDVQGTLGGNVRNTGTTGIHPGAIVSIWYEANNVLVIQVIDGVA
jgi:uncharacterized protein YxeA